MYGYEYFHIVLMFSWVTVTAALVIVTAALVLCFMLLVFVPFLILRHHWSQYSQAAVPWAVLFSVASGENQPVSECIKRSVCVCKCVCIGVFVNTFSGKKRRCFSFMHSSVTRSCLFTWIFFKINSLIIPVSLKNMFSILSVCRALPCLFGCVWWRIWI